MGAVTLAGGAQGGGPDRPQAQPRTSGVPTATGPAANGPIRSCRVCRKRLPKAQLTRWVRQEGRLVADPSQRLTGRGLYTCSDTCAARLGSAKSTIKTSTSPTKPTNR